uniref:Uncharacterized protein n=1 Tax=Panagrolaimus sp. PS1159 TaxID=55785 RepID=A0AC35F5R5_9BILA
MGLFAGILMVLSLGYGMIFAFQCLAVYSAPKSDPCRSSASASSMGVGFIRAADINKKKSSKKRKITPISNCSSNQCDTLEDEDFKTIPAIRSPTVRSLI